MTNQADKQSSQESDFARQARAVSPGLIREFWDFLCHNKKWWLIPVLVVLLLVGVLVVLSSTGVGAFIYAGL